LKLFGLVTGGWLMAKAALAAQRRRASEADGDAAFLAAKLATARFFAEHELATAAALTPAILGGRTVTDFNLDAF